MKKPFILILYVVLFTLNLTKGVKLNGSLLNNHENSCFNFETFLVETVITALNDSSSFKLSKECHSSFEYWLNSLFTLQYWSELGDYFISIK